MCVTRHIPLHKYQCQTSSKFDPTAINLEFNSNNRNKNNLKNIIYYKHLMMQFIIKIYVDFSLELALASTDEFYTNTSG